MGMPQIIQTDVDRAQAINAIMQSIALTEAAVAHILNAQGEHLQYLMKMDKVTPKMIQKMCCCTGKTLESATQLENALKDKLCVLHQWMPNK